MWDKIATMWAGKENWMEARRKKSTLEEKLNRMKLSTEHRKSKSKRIEKMIKDETPRDLGPEDTTPHSK